MDGFVNTQAGSPILRPPASLLDVIYLMLGGNIAPLDLFRAALVRIDPPFKVQEMVT